MTTVKLLFLFSLLLTLSACPADTQDRPPSAAPAADAPLEIGRPGGTRTFSVSALPNSFHPYLSSDQSSLAVIYQLFTGLVRVNAQTRELEPSLAVSWEISADQRTYTFKLREGLKWSDGHPLTSADVVFTYKDVLPHPQINSNYRDFWSYQGGFPEVSAPDALTVIFRLKAPFAPALFNLAAPILPRHVLASTLTSDTSGRLLFNQQWDLNTPPEKIVSNGPWQLVRHLPGQRIELGRNPHYYEKDAQGQPLPYLERLILLEIPDANAALLKFERGEIDSYTLKSGDYERLAPALKTGAFQLYNLGATPNQLFIMFNQSLARREDGQPVVDPIKAGWFRNPLFRQALAHSLDKNALIQAVYKGRAESQTSHLSRYNPYFASELPDYMYNPQQASNLLFKAGFKQNAQGALFDPNGHRVRFELTTNTGNTERDAICGLLIREWARLGIQIDYRPHALNVLTRQIHESFDWEVMLLGMAGSPLEPHFSASRWKRDGRMHLFNMGSGPQWQGKPTTHEAWEGEMENLYTQAALTLEPDARKALYIQAQKLEREHLPFLYLVSELNLLAVSTELGNIRPSVFGGSGPQQINWNSQYHYVKTPQTP